MTKIHEHEFVAPANDDAQQCDADCRENWHRCSVCGKSRSEINKQAPAVDKKHRMTKEQLLAILRREFPLMSSRQLRFMSAHTIVEYFLEGEIKGCSALNAAIEKYIAEEL